MKKEDWVDHLMDQLKIVPVAAPVPISLVIPTYQCGERIEASLESVAGQHYPNLEVIVVDGGSTDHTLSIVRRFGRLIHRIYSIATNNQAKMLNRGITLSTGRYITFLYPGSLYLSCQALHAFAAAAEKDNFPDLIYSGLIKRELRTEATVINAPFDPEAIKQGRFFGSVAASLFRADLFQTVGKFDAELQLRGGFDFVARLVKRPDIRIKHLDRVLMDVDLGPFSYGKALLFSWETWRVLSRQFGIGEALGWAWHLDQRALLRAFWLQLKQHVCKK